ncbi:MAG: flagellar hook-associated protein FlgK [Planctomycetes bacterium B3_Pla]|nr:MAG: flagellar hook-associated protein FlgK [Planctomycetes bacterium B3_Pla]
MNSFDIGISGLKAAQEAIGIVGNNIANAATDGYHRQRIELAPAYASQVGTVLLGGGVDVIGYTRMIDGLLEKEILRQQSSLEQTSQELATLRTVESMFAELSSETGLSAAIDDFFNALQDLSAHPGEAIWQNQAVSAAETMAAQFRMLGDFLDKLQAQLRFEAENTVEQINALTGQIAELNKKIVKIEIDGGQANNLRDQRDQRITELSELVGLETQQREYGAVDVSIAGISVPVVANTTTIALEADLTESGKLGISVAGAFNYKTNIQGGRLGGLLSLRNELVSDVSTDLNSLANEIIQQMNQYHVQAVGSEGRFTQLTSWGMASENLADFNPPVTDGNIYLRVTNTSTGAVTRTAVAVDASADSLTTIAAAISSITGLTASVSSSKLSISADTYYEFDFLPAVLSGPTAAVLTGTTPPAISVSGIYAGTQNDTFQFTVSGAGLVGNGALQLEVKDNGGAGDVIATLNIGSGYAAGDELDIGNGIKVSVGAGDFGAGDNFEIDAFADTDTSGVLAAVGLNTFFSGNSAMNIAVRSEISDTPGRIATALGTDMTDNANALRMAAAKDQAVSNLNSLTIPEFYRRLASGIGQLISVRQMRQDNMQVVVQNLNNQQSELSGVDINDEAARMLLFEQMFRAMAKYLNTVQSSLEAVMEIL